MLELRWVLLGLGLLAIVGVYLWTVLLPRFKDRRQRPSEPQLRSTEAAADDGSDHAADEAAHAPVEAGHAPMEPDHGAVDAGPQGVVTLRLIARNGEALDAEQAVLALREAGLRHGRYGIFHCSSAENDEEADFYVANLVEPGSFDLSNLSGSTLPGMSFFMVLPGPGDPVYRFDRMIGVARRLTQSLDAELFDEQGSSWSLQRERHVREELIEYRHRQNRV